MSESAMKWWTSNKHVRLQTYKCVMPGMRLPTQLLGITALRPVPNYTAW